MTSTMKSEPATPPIRDVSACGVAGFGGDGLRGRRQRRRQTRGGRASRHGRVGGLRRDCAGGAGDGHARSETCGDRRSGRNPWCRKSCVPWSALPRFEFVGGDLTMSPRCRDGRTVLQANLSHQGRRPSDRQSPARSNGTFRAREASNARAPKHLIGKQFPFKQRTCTCARLRCLPEVPTPHNLNTSQSPRTRMAPCWCAALALGICGTDREIISGAYGEAPPGKRTAGSRP